MHCKYICTNYSHRFQQNRLIFLLWANRPGAKGLGGQNDQGRNDLGRNAAGAKRLGGELDLGRNDPDSWQPTPSSTSTLFLSKFNKLLYIRLLSVAHGHPPPHCENTQVIYVNGPKIGKCFLM